MSPRDYYRTLQVDPAAEPEVIAAAYRRLAQKYHPDASPAPDAHQRMAAINEAYSVLSDPARRAEYDARRAARRVRRSAPRPAPAPPPTSHEPLWRVEEAPAETGGSLWMQVLAVAFVLLVIAAIAAIGLALSTP
jgi:curved DNA-binding protein CbpA